MQMLMLTIRDRAIDSYGRPMFFQTEQAAIRTFKDEINRAHQDNPMYQHPEDFDLYTIGIYDDQTAQVEMLPQPRQIAVGKDHAKHYGISMTVTGKGA